MYRTVSPSLSDFADKSNDVPGLDLGSYEFIAMASARIYHAQLGAKHGEWCYSRLKGTLVFGMDLHNTMGLDAEKFWFRLIDEDTAKVVWIFRFPAGLDYQVDRPFFHVIQGKVRSFH